MLTGDVKGSESVIAFGIGRRSAIQQFPHLIDLPIPDVIEKFVL
jgi:hypothetical protein